MVSKFKKGDQVIVIAGNDKGRVGKILLVCAKKVVVEKVNIATVHKKKAQDGSGIVKVEKPIHKSNVSHVENGVSAKVTFFIDSVSDGKSFTKKRRIFKKSRANLK